MSVKRYRATVVFSASEPELRDYNQAVDDNRSGVHVPNDPLEWDWDELAVAYENDLVAPEITLLTKLLG